MNGAGSRERAASNDIYFTSRLQSFTMPCAKIIGQNMINDP